MVSGQRLLDWADGRYASRFEDLRWSKDETTIRRVKGVKYAFLDATTGEYVARYASAS